MAAIARKKRKKRTGPKARNWKHILFYVLGGLVIISMTFGFVLSFLIQ